MSPPNSAPSDSGTGRPSRRGVLVGVGAAGLLGLLGLRACVPWRTDAVPGDLRTLTRGEARLFMRVIPVFLPVAGTALVPLDRIDVLHNIDRQAARLPREARALLRQALFALDHGAVVLGGRLTRAANLDDADLHAWLVAWSEGGALQRAAFGAVKQLVALGYFGDPGTWAPLQYDGPITGPRAIPRLGNQPLPEV
jgi:hypothetical protein